LGRHDKNVNYDDPAIELALGVNHVGISIYYPLWGTRIMDIIQTVIINIISARKARELDR